MGKLEPAEPSARNSSNRADGNNFLLLRLILAALVIVSHSFELVDGDRHREPLVVVFHTISFGELAVDGFFILSGYLIAVSYLRSKSPTDYVRKRILRIYPGYWAAFLIGILVFGPLGSPNALAYLHAIPPRSVALQMGVLTMQPLPPTFLDTTDPILNGSLWTIPWELGCYIAILLLGMSTLLRRRWAVAIAFALCVTFYLRACAHDLADSQNTWCRFGAFFLGGTLVHYVRPHFAPSRIVTAILVVALVVCSFHSVLSQLAQTTLGSWLLIDLAFAPIPFLAKLEPRWDISYGVYLYAWPVQLTIIQRVSGVSPYGVIFGAMAVCGVLGALSWKLIEEPMLRFKPRRTPERSTLRDPS